MSGADRLSIRAAALALDDCGGGRDKPDTKQDVFADLGSPVSPLRRPGATPSSSSSSTGSAKSPALCNAAAGRGRGSHSGELAADGERIGQRRAGHRRSGSGPLIFSGGSSSAGSGGRGCGGDSTASSPLTTNALPTGNICPSGRVNAAPPPRRARPDVLGSGTGHYGHGSIIRGGGVAPARSSIDAGSYYSRSPASLQEVTRAGNEWYKKGNYGEALRHYDQAVALCPDSAACRSNRAAALAGLGRLADALRECDDAIRRDPTSARAHSRLATLCLRFGMVERARKHFMLAGQANQSDHAELQKLQEVEQHLGRCMDARKTGDWKNALREADAAIANGADSSQLLLALRSEALLRLNKLEEADSTITSLSKLDNVSLSSVSTKLSGMIADSYVHVVQAQVNMAFGSTNTKVDSCRFDTAVTMAEKARVIDPGNLQIGRIINNIRLVAQAREQGNKLFKAGRFAEASIAYGEGLKYEPSNPVLYCNRAACWSKLGRWVKAVEDCNEALKIQPGYTKALLRRAASYAKLERWADCVWDYEVLRKELPSNMEVAESLFHAQVALKTTRGEEVANMKFGGEFKTVASIEQLRDAIHSPGVSVVYFMATMNQRFQQITPSVDSLFSECPSVNFLKVNIDESPMVARAENVRIVPTFKIYKDGARVKEMICPSLHILRYSIRHYAVSSS
uniref:Thioredoxin domain-containing protein n=1 Tax=Leersia perrieri TaxID=77586 RepID=A0A0D9WKE7_9ORYZ